MIYLNNAALGWPPAPGVEDAVREWLSKPPEESGRSAGKREDLSEGVRRKLAGIVGASDPGRIVFTLNATHALNLAILGLEIRPGSLVVTSVTEHNSVLRPLYRLRDEQGVRLRILRVDSAGRLDCEGFRSALADGPRLVALNHASNVSGNIHDVGPWFAAARRAGAITLLDASQTAGITPIDAAALDADLIAFPGHKGLHGPPGIGCLYVDSRITLRQTIVGGTGSRSDLERHPEEMPVRLEPGTLNGIGLAGLSSALCWFEQYGCEARKRIAVLTARLRARLQQIAGVRLFGSTNGTAQTGVVSFGIEGWDPAEAGFALRESFGVICRSGLHCAPLIHQHLGSAPSGTIRFSVSPFNTPDEIDAASDSVRRLSLCVS
jgi:cysteine desulfurase/selenocysteine lyase